MEPGSNRPNLWTPTGRAIIFALAATSIWCLLAEFYGVCSMRTFTFAVSLPAMIALAGLYVFDLARGNGGLARAVGSGAVAGLVAAVAYDVFRLPFVFANEWGIAGIVPPMNLFKVFPRFGAMILGEPREQASYSLAAHALGWTYHFSNGLTFGVMYAAMIGDPSRRSWFWAVAMSVGLELGMLFTPYPQAFGIHLGPLFVAVTMVAHLIFGVALGFWMRETVKRERAL